MVFTRLLKSSVASEATQQKFQCLPWSSTCQVPTDLCGANMSQRVVRVRLAEFTRPGHTKILPYGGSVLHSGDDSNLACEGKIHPILEPHTSVSLGFYSDPLESPSLSGQASRSDKHGATGFSVVGKYLLCPQKRGNGFYPRTTQLNL